MDNIGKEYRNILNNIEEKLKDNPELEYVKSEFTNLFILFFNEIDSLRETYEEKFEAVLQRQSYFEEKILNIENELSINDDDTSIDEISVQNLKEFEDEDIDDDEYEVICPYCNEPFDVDAQKIDDEVSCPHCNNLVELDWNFDSDDFDNDESRNKSEDDK